MTALQGPVAESRLARVWSVASDLFIATAVIWAIPLALGAIAAVARLLF